ncbi:unnamed protein product, partial [Medioppia subpectinata]
HSKSLQNCQKIKSKQNHIFGHQLIPRSPSKRPLIGYDLLENSGRYVSTPLLSCIRYLRYSSIAARQVRQSLKVDLKADPIRGTSTVKISVGKKTGAAAENKLNTFGDIHSADQSLCVTTRSVNVRPVIVTNNHIQTLSQDMADAADDDFEFQLAQEEREREAKAAVKTRVDPTDGTEYEWNEHMKA